MVDVGEETGELDTMLYKVADTYDEEVAVLTEADDGSQKGHPNEEEARELFGNRDATVERITQDDIAEDHHHHQRQADDDGDLQQLEVALHDP